MKKVAIIPLKSDSVRFPDKNFKCINGKPLLINTMNKLNDAGVDLIIISTDKVQRAYDILKNKNALSRYDNYFVLDRHNSLMGDAKTELVILDVINDMKSILINDEDYTIILTQTTSPLWSHDELKLALEKLNHKNIDSVISVFPSYTPNGCFYVFNKNTFLKHNKIFTDNTFLISMPWEESVDIDYEHELSIANALQRGNYV